MKPKKPSKLMALVIRRIVGDGDDRFLKHDRPIQVMVQFHFNHGHNAWGWGAAFKVSSPTTDVQVEETILTFAPRRSDALAKLAYELNQCAKLAMNDQLQSLGHRLVGAMIRQSTDWHHDIKTQGDGRKATGLYHKRPDEPMAEFVVMPLPAAAAPETEQQRMVRLGLSEARPPFLLLQ